mmetsp:Transcript_661/g.1378  ORF Transcript_661/g.1378 Transcript_661/m.1378 type:complete len:233 (+) Transcript_661:2546-3244(+)
MPKLRCGAWHLVQRLAPGVLDAHLAAPQRGAQLGGVHAQQLGGLVQDLIIQLHRCSLIAFILFSVREVAQMHETSQDLENGINLFITETHGGQGAAEMLEEFGIPFLELRMPLHLLDRIVLRISGLASKQQIELVPLQLQLRQLFIWQTSQHLVEAMVCSLAFCVNHHPGAFEQVRGHRGINQSAGFIKEDAIVLAEARGVVVPHGHCVSKRFQDRLGLLHPSLDLLCLLIC